MEPVVVDFEEKSFYSGNEDIRRLFRYIAGKGSNEEKERVSYVGACGLRKKCDIASDQVIKMQEFLDKAVERRIYHVVISFEENVRDETAVINAAKRIGKMFFKQFQIFYGVHTSTDNLHIHMAINAVSYKNGLKWHSSKKDLEVIKQKIRELVECCID